MKKLLLATILTIGSTSAFAMSDYTYCKKFSELGGKTVDIRSQGYSKETLLDELNKHGAITVENKAMLDFAYSIPLTSDLDGDIENFKRMVFTICMDEIGG